MHKIVNDIFFDYVQLTKGNRNKRINKRFNDNLLRLKEMDDNSVFCECVDRLFDNANFRNIVFSGNLFPRTVESIGSSYECCCSKEIVYDIRWNLKLFEKYADEINTFISLKQIIDEEILNEQYEEALDNIQTVEKFFGVSFWSLENKLFLLGKCGRDIEKDIIKNKCAGPYYYIIYFYDMKASEEVQTRDYNYLTKRELSLYQRAFPKREELVAFYHYMIAPFSFELSEKSIANVMTYAGRLPLIDRYFIVTDFAKYFLAQQGQMKTIAPMKVIGQCCENIGDTTLSALRFVFAELDKKVNEFALDDSTLQVKDKYYAGNIEEAFLLAKDVIENDSTDIEIYNLYIELCQLLGKEIEDVNVSKNKRNILLCLNEIYSVSHLYSDSIDKIDKLCISSFRADWARNIYFSITKMIQPLDSIEYALANKYLALEKLRVESLYALLSDEEMNLYLEKKGFLNNSVFARCMNAIKQKDTITALANCNVDCLKIIINLFNNKEYDAYEKALAGTVINMHKVYISKLLWENVNSNSGIENGIDYFIHLFIEQEEYAIIAPVHKFVDYINGNESIDKSNIRVPIMHYIFSTYFEPQKRDDLSMACEDFFFLNNYDKPTELPEKNDAYTKEELVFFLKNVCVQQILGPVLLTIRTSKALDEERINICQYLRQLDPENGEEYDKEITETTHKIFINDRVSTIETKKIEVNTDGIKQRVSKELSSVFNKYMYTRNAWQESLINAIKEINSLRDVQLSIVTIDASQIFNELVTTIRNEFVLGAEYGLDSYLSLNIRHGTLSAQLRAPLQKKNLLAIQSIDDYEIDNRWLYRINNESDAKRVRNAIIEFTNTTNEIIDYMKKDLIQISTEEKPTNGVFRYHFDPSEIKIFQTYVGENTSFEEFIDFIFAELWKMTDENLANMRCIIRDNIKKRYIDAFSKLSLVYLQLKQPFPDAERWIKEAQNDIDAELEKICDWFMRANDGQYADFDFDLAFQVGFQTIKNIHPEKRFEIGRLSKNNDKKISGKNWKSYCNVFYTLFDNVSQYAEETDGKILIDSELESTDKGIVIHMRNDFDCSKDISDAQKRIERAERIIKNPTSYLSQVKKEGGSGIPKVNKIFKIDLNMDVTIKCDVCVKDNKFDIKIVGNYK